MNSTEALPLSLIYGHLHDRLRDELQNLRQVVAELQQLNPNLQIQLQSLRHRFGFVLQVYRYHSTVEDEVVYPVLDTFVKNVTLSYVVEHQDDIGLLEDLLYMLDAVCFKQEGQLTSSTWIRQFQSKVEAVHVSLLKHMDKEEQQLYPLLVKHFSKCQQAQMIAKLLCCIPITRVRAVLDWWLQETSDEDKHAIITLLQSNVPDFRLVQLFTSWLCPQEISDQFKQPSFVYNGVGNIDPLAYIYRLHELIRNGMKDFVEQIRQAQLPYSCIVPQQWEQLVSLLKGLLSCHRFLQALCDFHCSSEDDVVFPVAREKSPVSVLDECGTQHRQQGKLFDQVGRLLADLRGAVRRQSIEMLDLLHSLQDVASKSGLQVDQHMTLEEQFVLPRLECCLDLPTKCELVWQSFKAMPLRMLRKIIPKITNDSPDFAQFLAQILKTSTNQNDLILSQLLWDWILSNKQSNLQQKRQKREKDTSPSNSSDISLEQRISFQPIDQIFRFHKALTRELDLLTKYAANVEELTRQIDQNHAAHMDEELFQLMQKLSGCFEFLWGIYQAHSHAEDKFVFPALEKKDALRNVSYAYMLEHQKEESLFVEISGIIQSMISEKRAKLATQLHDKCVALYAAVHTHVRSEESEIWPLFKEHFSVQEQEELVQSIASQTGAEVLWRLIPFVQSTLKCQDAQALKISISQTQENSVLENWLSSLTHGHSSPYFDSGWSRIFSVNSHKVESALRASEQPNDYLLANYMASQYIVAQTGNSNMQHQCRNENDTSQEQELTSTITIIMQPEQVTYYNLDKRILGCQHYQRRCRLIAPCCNQIFTCRQCHDQDSHHVMNRYQIQEMICMLCSHRQPVNAVCSNCQQRMAAYYCEVCRFFDDDQQHDIYHCQHCRVCRVGKGLGVDSFHCNTCNICMLSSGLNQHQCKVNILDDVVCPICLENSKDSVQQLKELSCGHFIHTSCLDKYTKYNYTCPICLKTIGDMSLYFNMLDSVVAMECFPEELRGKYQRVLCNDCGNISQVGFHYVYHKCGDCQSYNTRVV